MYPFSIISAQFGSVSLVSLLASACMLHQQTIISGFHLIVHTCVLHMCTTFCIIAGLFGSVSCVFLLASARMLPQLHTTFCIDSGSDSLVSLLASARMLPQLLLLLQGASYSITSFLDPLRCSNSCCGVFKGGIQTRKCFWLKIN